MTEKSTNEHPKCYHWLELRRLAFFKLCSLWLELCELRVFFHWLELRRLAYLKYVKCALWLELCELAYLKSRSVAFSISKTKEIRRPHLLMIRFL